jgi:hypothetical protein
MLIALPMSVKKEKYRPVSRVLYLVAQALIIYPGLPSQTSSINLPAGIGRVTLSRSVKLPAAGLFGLSTRKVYPAPAVASKTVGSYPTISPLPQQAGAVYFLWHFL